MARFFAIILLFGILSSCFHRDQTQIETRSESNKGDLTVVESQQTAITKEELIKLLEQIDMGDIEGSDLEKYRGVHIPTQTIHHWTQEKAQNNDGYGSGGSLIPEPTGDRGALDKVYLPDRIVFLYSIFDDKSLVLSDWLIVEKQRQYFLIEEIAIIENLTDKMNSNLGIRDKFQFGLVHFDFEDYPLVYEQWFHPDAVIKINPDSGTLDLVEEVSPNQYIMIEGV